MMGMPMHRLQISLPEWQVRFILERARAEGSSMAGVIRQLISREAEARASQSGRDGLWDIAGIAEDAGPLEAGVAVSERPELYLADAASRAPGPTAEKPTCDAS